MQTSWFFRLGLFSDNQQLLKMRQLGDVANVRCNRVVMQYSTEDQSRFLSRLRFDLESGTKALKMSILAIVLIGATVLFGLLLFRKGAKREPRCRTLVDVLQKASGDGCIAKPNTRPLALLNTLRQERKELYDEAHRVIDPYIALRCRGMVNSRRVQEFMDSVKRLLKKRQSYTQVSNAINERISQIINKSIHFPSSS